MTDPVIIGNATLYQGDCIDVMRGMEAESVDSIVCDPPYALSFMGRDWDKGFPDPAIWAECLRILKPGAHLLAFGGTRTHHRLWCQIEDAGLKIIDNIAWVFGSGFPKHKSLLKPAFEPICLAHKQGKRWLNIDECRVPLAGKESPEDFRRVDPPGHRRFSNAYAQDQWTRENFARNVERGHEAGRWPCNLIHDGTDDALSVFDGTAKLARPGNRYKGHDDFDPGQRTVYAGGWKSRLKSMAEAHFDDSGSAKRFFYCAKASQSDRDEGNTHPTVKPTALMAYLCRLVTPPGGIVLDPFMGSGSTGKAAMRERFRFIGIERDADYFGIACERIENAQRQQTLDLEQSA